MAKGNKFRTPKGMRWIACDDGGYRLEDNRSRTAKVASQMSSFRAARRDAEIQSGCNPTSGCGVHAPTQLAEHKRSRQQAKQRLNRGDYE